MLICIFSGACLSTIFLNTCNFDTYCGNTYQGWTVALMSPRPTSQIISLTAESKQELSYPVNSCKSHRLLFHFKFQNGDWYAKVIGGQHFLFKRSYRPSQLCLALKLEWCLHSGHTVQSHCTTYHSKYRWSFTKSDHIRLAYLRQN